MTSLGLAMIGVLADIARSSILMDQASMMQLPLQKEGSKQLLLDQLAEVVAFPGRITELRSTLFQKCETLTWVTKADCAMGMQLVDLILAQNGGETGNDLDVAKRLASVYLTVYSSPGAILQYDTDGSGDLSPTELRPVVDEGMGLKGEKGTADIMAVVDRDHDGKVTMKEVYDFGRGCLVLREFLPEIDTISPGTATVDLLPSLDKNTWHLPPATPENLKWHQKFKDLSANISAQCHTLDWATETDCERADVLLKLMLQLPVHEGTKTLGNAQLLASLMLFLHTPDQFGFGALDPDGDRAFGWYEFQALAAPLFGQLGQAGMQNVFYALDRDGTANVTRTDVYDYIRGALVIRHFIPEIDSVSPGKMKDGTPVLLDSAALNMALHVIDPPPVQRPKLQPGPKLLCLIGIMITAFVIQWFCCAAKPKLDADVAEDEYGVKAIKIAK